MFCRAGARESLLVLHGSFAVEIYDGVMYQMQCPDRDGEQERPCNANGHETSYGSFDWTHSILLEKCPYLIIASRLGKSKATKWLPFSFGIRVFFSVP